MLPMFFCTLLAFWSWKKRARDQHEQRDTKHSEHLVYDSTAACSATAMNLIRQIILHLQIRHVKILTNTPAVS